jgi:hypothetical protein
MPPADALLLVALCAIWGFAQVMMKWSGEGF